jgi:hypothetical protein
MKLKKNTWSQVAINFVLNQGQIQSSIYGRILRTYDTVHMVDEL